MEIKVYLHRTKKKKFEVADCFSVFVDLDKLPEDRKNDLDYIPKQITYKGKKLDLLKTKWEETENKPIGNATIGTKYKAICYYATKERVYNPTTYTITADYKGIAEKKVEKPLKITLS